MTPSDRDVAIVIPTHRRRDRWPALVHALAQQTFPAHRWELLAVEDGPGDPEVEAMLSALARGGVGTRVLATGGDAGPAVARNMGWRATRARFVAFTDDDCLPTPEWLAEGVAALEADEAIGIVQGRTLAPPDAAAYPFTLDTVVREVPEPSPWFEGCNLFVRRDALEASSGFDEDIGWYGEDTALGWGVLYAGWRRGWAPDAVVHHELTDRPFRWHLRNRRLSGNYVRLVAKYPRLREELWRPWAVSPTSPYLALAIAGGAASFRWKPAILLALPYARMLKPRRNGVEAAEEVARKVVQHTAVLTSSLIASVKWRAFLI